ncbi:MAG TPA: histone deacetylase [Anaeromyxobacteraceae bacterium]|nr:histone deacetylase [Anaeromyxobacteraceae bacterium]
MGKGVQESSASLARGSTLLVTHPASSEHDTGPGHFETERRVEVLLEAVRADAVLLRALRQEEGTPAADEDLLRVHTPEHLARVREAAAEAGRRNELVWLDDDTPVSKGSFEAARAAAGVAITAAEAVLAEPGTTAFALARPPGHHAGAGRAMGFCLFNNLAIAVRSVQARGSAGRVLVVDLDAHHGNGTQDIFYEDPTVYVLSLHLGRDFPGTGTTAEKGKGPGEGTTRNVPLRRGTALPEYRRRYLQALEVALASFEPDLVAVSMGLDTLAGDPQGGFSLEPRDLHVITTDLLERLPSSSKGRVLAVLEGGYGLDRIGAGLVNVLRALARLPAV